MSALAMNLFLAGNVLLFVGERALGAGHDQRMAAAGLASALIATGLGLRARAWFSATGDLRAALGRTVMAMAFAVLSVALYGAVADGSDLVTEGDLRVVLSALWPLLWLASVLPLVLMDLGLRGMAGTATIEARRIDESARTGVVVALAAGWLFALNYAANERDERWDLRTIKTVEPGKATVEMVRNLTEPVVISLLFPPGNDVLESIRPYFAQLDEASTQLTIEEIDRDERPARAKELRVRSNGTVVLTRGDTHESIALDVDAEKARKKVKKLDEELQKKLAKVSESQKVAYVVTGHGERSTSPGAEDLAGLKDLKEVLGYLNYKVKKLGLADGLADKVPDDATIVFLIGPRKAMLEAERDALLRYVEAGGALFLAVDPDVEADPELDPLLTALGVRVDRTVLAHDSKYARLAENPSRTDRTALVTNRFTTHDSLSVLGKMTQQAAVVVSSAGSLDKIEGLSKEGGPDVQVTIRSMTGTWQDGNGDLEFQKDGEKKDVFQLVAAVQLPKKEGAEGPGGRAVVMTDADLVSDLVLMRNPGNGQLLVDGVRWLEDNLELAAEISEVEDVAILHTKNEDKAWFYGTTLGVPAALLGFGLVIGRRTKRRKSA